MERALRANPVLALLAGLLAVALFPLAFAAGRRLGGSVGVGVAGDEGSALLFSVDVGLAALLGGCSLAFLAPGERALGTQLRAAPLTRLESAVALTALPFAVFLVPVIAGVALFALPFAEKTRGGPAAGLAIVAGTAAGIAVGAALAEGLVTASRGSPSGAAVLLALGALWSGAAALAGAPVLVGPLPYVGGTLRGDVGTLESVAVLAAIALCAFALSALAVAVRPPERARGRRLRPLVPIPTRPAGALVAASCKRLFRQRELRRAACGSVLFALGGAAVFHALLGLPLVSTFFLSASLAALGAALVPLAAFGLDADASWLWYASPTRPALRAVACSGAALSLGLATASASIIPVGVVASAGIHDYANVGGATLVTLAAAGIAGALVPWRPDRLTDQLPSYAAFFAALIAVWLTVSALVELAERTGAPAWVAPVGALTLAPATVAVTAAIVAEHGSER